MTSAENNKRIAKNTIYLYFRMIILIAVSFYTVRVILENLGVEDYGLYNVVAGFVSMISFLNQSMTNSIQRFINYEMGRGDFESLNKHFESALLSQSIISLIVVCISESIGIWFLNSQMNIPSDKVFAANVVFQLSILTLIFKILEAPFTAIIIAKEKMNFYAMISLFEAFGKLFIAYSISIVKGNKIETYAFLLFVISLIVIICNVFYAKKLMTIIRIRLKYYKNILKNILSFSGWNLFGAASGVIQGQGINVLMNIFFGVAINAARGVAYQISACIDQFVGNFQVAINPQIVQSYALKDMNRYKELTFYSAKISFVLIWFFTLPLLFCVEKVMNLWLGTNVPEHTVSFVKIIMCISLVNAFASSISVPIYATGKIKNYQVTVSTINILVLPISYVFYLLDFIPETSMYVAFFIAIIAQIVRVFIWSRLTKFKTMHYVKEIILPALCIILISTFLLMITYSYIPDDFDFLNIICTVSLTTTVNIVLIYAIMLNTYERNKLKNIILKKLHT